MADEPSGIEQMSTSETIKHVVKVLIGLLLLVGVAYSLTWESWFWAVARLLQGGIVLLVFFIGLGLVLIGISELRD